MSQYAELMGPVARLLLGEPNRTLSSAKEWRYGTHGSLSVDLQKGTWFDHESGEGGGCYQLIVRERKCPIEEAPLWCERQGLEVPNDPDFRHKYNGANGKHHVAGKSAKPQRKIDKVFPYLDLLGHTLFEVVRYIPKDFRQRQPDGRGGHIWNLKGIKLVPYRLPEVAEAIAMGLTIFVVEGEKCADMLWSHGIPATCNPMGAGNWADELNPYFVGADVVVVGDFDPQKKDGKGALKFHEDGRPVLPGQDHALAVACTLNGVATRVRVLDLAVHWMKIAPKQDVFDWFSVAGHTPELFHTLVEHAVDWTPEVTLLWPADAPDILPVTSAFPIEGSKLSTRPWEIPGLLLRGHLTILVAPPGIGKSLLTLQIAMVCANGKEWGGWWPRASYRSLIINVEEDLVEMRRRLYGACEKMSLDQKVLADKIFLAEATDIVVAKADNRTKTVVATPMLEKIVQTIKAMQIDLVVVDPFAETFAGDENSNSELKWAAALWREVARKTNCSVLLVHHAKKYSGNMAGDMDAARGGGSLSGVARIVSTLFTITPAEYGQFESALIDQAKKENEEREKAAATASGGPVGKKKIEKVKPIERARLLRFDDAKAQYSLVSSSARWFCKHSVGIGNAFDDGVNQIPEDEVGVLMPWKPPVPIISPEAFHEILDEIGVGLRDSDGKATCIPYSKNNTGKSNKRWVGDLLVERLECSESGAAWWIEKWCEDGLLVEYKAKIAMSKRGGKKLCACLRVNEGNRPPRPERAAADED